MNLFYSNGSSTGLNLDIDVSSGRDIIDLSCRIQSDLQDTEQGHRVLLQVPKQEQLMLAYKLKSDIMDSSLYRHIADMDAIEGNKLCSYFDIEYRKDSGIEMSIDLDTGEIEFIRVEIPDTAFMLNRKLNAEIRMGTV